MLRDFKAFIEREKLFPRADRVLLAVSGGIDSVVMCDLMYRGGYKFDIAHCNFGLRGEESDGDQVFVEKLSANYSVAFHVKRFLTKKYAGQNGISIQMAARDLRYEWFKEIIEKEGYSCVATAHHLDDQAETFFINLLRNTGIAGLHGIFPKQGHLVRPMLFATREAIAAYAFRHKTGYREDSSNSDVKYIRNKIRHEIIPIFKEMNPAFIINLSETANRLRETEVVMHANLDAARDRVMKTKDDGIHISLKSLRELNPQEIHAFTILSPFGFNETVILEILHSPDGDSGKVFLSHTHRLVRNRNELILTEIEQGQKTKTGKKEIIIPDSKKELRTPLHLNFLRIHINDFVLDSSPEVANLDNHKIVYPLMLRKWKKGDYFHPFGMRGKKKLSDFFIDNKLSIPEKENIWLLCSGSHIIWVVGQRPDNRFRVTSATKEVLQVRWTKEKKS